MTGELLLAGMMALVAATIVLGEHIELRLIQFKTRPFQEVQAGNAQLRGRARATASVVAPISGEEVVGAIITVAAEHDLHWRSLTLKTIASFDLDDGSGCIRVEVDERTRVSIARQSTRELVQHPSPELVALLQRTRAGRKLLRLEGLVAFERVLRDGDMVTVRGCLAAGADDEATDGLTTTRGYRGTPRKRILVSDGRSGHAVEQGGVLSHKDAGITC